MKHKVLSSLENSFGDRCVDVFERADGTFGFEELRLDPEDGGRWLSLRKYSGQIFASRDAALETAKATVEWLRE